ncbi:MAG: tripartite tricarboxylate transporter substrate binding protein [Comamonas sp.]
MIPSRREFLLASASAAGASALALHPAIARAQDGKWPTKLIRIVVPFPAGSITDNAARMLADGLAKSLGQPVIVENKGGANGSIGVAEVARSAPDGYTLLVTNSSSITVNPLVYKNSPYKTKDLTPISVLLDAPFILNVNPAWAHKHGINSLHDLVAYAKRKPGELSYGSGGIGNIAHLSFVMLSNSTHIEANHVPYKAGSQASMAAMAGEINALFDTLTSVPQVRAGKLKALAVTTPERIAQLPDVPTTAEAGFPDVSPSFWLGLLAPSGTPQAIVDRLYADTRLAMAIPAVNTVLSAQGAVVVQSPKEFAARVTTETAQYAEVVKKEKIALE